MRSVITLRVERIHQQLRRKLIPNVRHPRHVLNNAAPPAWTNSAALSNSIVDVLLPVSST